MLLAISCKAELLFSIVQQNIMWVNQCVKPHRLFMITTYESEVENEKDRIKNEGNKKKGKSTETTVLMFNYFGDIFYLHFHRGKTNSVYCLFYIRIAKP